MYVRPVDHQEFSTEIDIKRSRFITFIRRVASEEEARNFISDIKKRFPDARHHCSAYIYHVEGSNPVERSSDDGEPSGTAGTPMLDVLRGSGILDVAAVVVRYFGGTKLGAGGLVHAYSGAVSDCLAQVATVQRHKRELYSVDFNHADAGRFEAELRARHVAVVDTQYSHRVTLTLAVDPGQREFLENLLASLTQDGARLCDAGIAWIEQSH
ncbi:YigZ family protein [Corynebacterium silvaticum]|uniref:YigZ family protein n=1 Tax=Corynebacterium silvaticum TaxID=2320431 RepID=A0A7Y4P8E8_9CORY|nr:YigZ family protein [Corynebacterium silvaticum]ARU46444.1 YigZ family protein [Corynebacterium silvaticum]MBH5299587.1 YigZ family protein [Corynebacterium silvaticum]NOM64094.1 YigZ family protein [Corynebacterium silvaticum]NON69299.1 YigZ family protein [Corynebacterium silvaticum]TFA93948.1 YigZ family protein [Corynebacterium silvaticum]